MPIKLYLPLFVLFSIFSTSTPAEQFMAIAHSHNDYLQSKPLQDALNLKFQSVEADIWAHDELMVSHLGLFFKGTLEELYLRPLQERVDKWGSVYGDGRPFFLWIDIKEKKSWVRSELYQLLMSYPMLAVFSSQEIKFAPVVVILTGDEVNKNQFVSDYPLSPATRDSEHFNFNDPASDNLWSWYSFKWKKSLLGKTEFQEMIKSAHQKGRKVRIYGVPHSKKIWDYLRKIKVDLISVDKLKKFREYLKS